MEKQISLTERLIGMVQYRTKEEPAITKGELSSWMDEVVEDAIAMKEISKAEYNLYKENPYRMHIEVFKHVDV